MMAKLLLEQGQADIGSNGGKESILSMGTGAEFLMMGWLKKLPYQENFYVSGKRRRDRWIERYTFDDCPSSKVAKTLLCTARLSRVRCVLKYFKTEKESAVIFSRTKERKVLAEAKGRQYSTRQPLCAALAEMSFTLTVATSSSKSGQPPRVTLMPGLSPSATH